MMPEHASAGMIAGYRGGTLTPDELVALTGHLAGCAACRAKAAAERGRGMLLESLSGPHLAYEDLEALAKGGQSGLSHVANCDSCAAELADLRAFRAGLGESAKSRPKIWFVAPLAAVAAIALIAVFVRPVSVVPPSGTPPVANRVSLRDGGHLITLDSKGGLHGMAAASPVERDLVAEALRSGRLPLPVNPDLIRPRETLLGSGVADIGVKALSPAGTVVLSARPVFQWVAPKGARGFRVAVYDSSFELVQSGEVNGLADWMPPTPLQRGSTYTWTISAVIDGKRLTAPHAPEPEARFSVATTEAARELEGLENAPSPSPLRIAVTAARLGMRAEAAAALDHLERDNAGSPLPTRLRESLESVKNKDARR